MLNIIRHQLQRIIEDIDVGNSNITEEDAATVIGLIRKYTDKTKRLSKYQACKKLNVSRATFDNMIRAGKIPKGIKEQGFKELSWTEKDLDAVIRGY